MSTVDLYDVLNVPHDTNRNDIKRAYRELARKYHPDKFEGNAELFELITHAFNTLYDPHSRMEYDKLFRVSQQSHSGYDNLKSQYENYESARKTDITQLPKEDQKKQFQKEFEDFDKKHNFKRDNMGKMTASTTKQIFTDLELTREQDDIENSYNRVFDDGRFNVAKFNTLFDTTNKKNGVMIKDEGIPDAWEGTNNTNYGSIKNPSTLYADDEVIDACMGYAPISKINKQKNFTKKEVSEMKNASYTNDHNKNTAKYIKTIEERMADRNEQSQHLSGENMNFDDFNENPDCGGYGIFDKIGIDDAQSLQWNDNEDIKSRYKRLIEQRNRNNSD